MKKDYQQYITEDRRLTILRMLLAGEAYAANEYILSQLLDNCAHRVSSDQLRTDLAWLEEQGLLHVSTIADMQVATLNKRGQDVAEGRSIVPGIKRPSAEM